MYTLVFKWKDDTMVVFDVYHTKRGKQRIIGNIFCYTKDKVHYTAHGELWMFSIHPKGKANLKVPVKVLCDYAKNICEREEFVRQLIEKESAN